MSYSGSGAADIGTVGGGQVKRIQRGQATVPASSSSVVVTLPVAEEDANYQVSVVPVSSVGAIVQGNITVSAVAKTPTQFTITIFTATALGVTVTFDWVTFR